MATNEEVMILFKGTDNVSPVADKISNKVRGIGDSATGIRGKIQSVASSFDFVSSAITGVLGGMSLLDQATQMWNAATQRQTSEFYLGANIGTEKAKEMTKSIQDIVAQVPGDDTFMNMILSGSLAKQTDMTTDQLSKQASVVADYLAGSEMQGKNAMEAQQDMKSYILSGSTAELERSSILSNQVDKLKDKATIQERINALAEAEAAEKVAGLSGYDTAANALTEFQGQMEKAYADLGSMFLPVEQSILQGFLDINDSVGGGLATAIVGVSTALSGVATGIGTIGATFTGLNSMIEFFSGLKEVLFATETAETALAGATTVSTATTEAQTSVTSLLAASQFEAALAEAGLTEAEFANMAATYGATTALGAQEVATTSLDAATITAIASQTGLTEAQISGSIANAEHTGVLVAETGATEVASTGFMTLAGSIWATVWPILAVIAAVALIAVAFEQVGEYLGWWTDFGSMIDSVKAGVMRLWEAFKNSKTVQKAIQTVQLAFGLLKAAAQPVLDWLGRVWDDLFGGSGAGKGGPDAIGAIIDAFSKLDEIGSQVFTNIMAVMMNAYTAVAPIITGIKVIATLIMGMFSGNVGIGEGVMRIISVVASLHQHIMGIMLQIGKTILQSLGNALITLGPMIARFLLNAVVQILLFGARAGVAAAQFGLRVVNGIINFIRTLPSRVASFIRQLPGRISSAAGSVASAASSLGRQAYNGVVNAVTQIPGKVGEEFKGIASKVIAVGGELYNAAKDAAQKLWDGFNAILDQHSPGIFMRAIDYEFSGIPGMITKSIGYAYTASKNYASKMNEGFQPQLANPLNGFGNELTNVQGMLNNSLNSAYTAARNYSTQLTRGLPLPEVTLSNISTLRTSVEYDNKPSNTNGNNTYVAHFHEGAFDVDARNFTEKEAKGILVTAFESLNIDPDGGTA